MVTAPPESAETSKFVPKLIVPAVPTVEPLFFMITPVPDAVIPVSPEPSPTNEVAVTTPAMFTLSKFVCPSTSNSTKSPSPLNVVAVTTPALPS